MFNLALYQPQIPPNTGNIIRLAANTGTQLHLIRPYGFVFNDKRLVRAGLDYQEWADIIQHNDYSTFCQSMPHRRIFAIETCTKSLITDYNFLPGDCFLLGSETTGLPASVLESPAITAILRIPQCHAQRSLNLSNAAAVILYEAWRQQGFKGHVL